MKPGDRVKVNDNGDLGVNCEARPLIGREVVIVKITKAGLYQVALDDGRAYSLPKRNLDPLPEAEKRTIAGLEFERVAGDWTSGFALISARGDRFIVTFYTAFTPEQLRGIADLMDEVALLAKSDILRIAEARGVVVKAGDMVRVSKMGGETLLFVNGVKVFRISPYGQEEKLKP